tara:strand:- start:450 stop:719 length:270 start_codon:yes stop_codon:yes gene_type:complete
MFKLENFLDKNGKVNNWPAKRNSKLEVAKYVAGKFDEDRFYSEKEVNKIIDQWHTFGDYFMLRREMVDHKLLARERDGSKYWKVKETSL